MADVSLFDGAVWYGVFLFSTTLHEASHAWSAYRMGDDTAHRGGQVTLDPMPHIQREPFGMVLVPLLSYFLGGWMIGWASAPYDPHWASRHPRRAALMAMAGPASNLALVLFSGIMIQIGIALGIFAVPGSITFDHAVDAVGEGLPYVFATVLSIMFSLNLLLFLFNLIPFPPLDGSSIPFFFLSDEACDKYWDLLRTPGIALIGMLISWKLIQVIFSPVHLLAINLLYPGVNYR